MLLFADWFVLSSVLGVLLFEFTSEFMACILFGLHLIFFIYLNCVALCCVCATLSIHLCSFSMYGETMFLRRGDPRG